ncbi:uncharacterized protein LOC131060934 [Cryptomeria japonica]|uniref:uncharacterized protein LOC131060934 n=1 Tax=Cryptomeria japonica TaxID=3369 RepID=UPI0027DA38FF|nr:uncharacterized protein LOC131060934 [Cryptomeria japonica]
MRDQRLRFYQQKCDKFENILPPYTTCFYAGDEACQPHRLTIEVPDKGALGSYGLDDVRNYTSIHLTKMPEVHQFQYEASEEDLKYALLHGSQGFRQHMIDRGDKLITGHEYEEAQQ